MNCAGSDGDDSGIPDMIYRIMQDYDNGQDEAQRHHSTARSIIDDSELLVVVAVAVILYNPVNHV
jgi:hypothetical protein